MSRIFLSHSSDNNHEALALKIWLEDQGWKDEVFLDFDPVSGIKAGTRWKEALAQANFRCEAIICLTSPSWVSSSECVSEYRLAENINETFKNIRTPIAIFVAQIAELGSTDQDKTREWQGGRLFGDGPVTEIRLGPQHQPVRFLAEGLARLKHGLLEAGVSGILAKHFPWPPQDEPNRSPYRGLEPLEWKDAGIYFGRDAEILSGLAKLEDMRLASDAPIFVILGPSGTGKSSFLRAGLLPRLFRNDRRFFPLEVIRPQYSPLFGDRGLAVAIYKANSYLNLAPSNLGDIKAGIKESADSLATLLLNIQKAAHLRLPALQDNSPPPTLVLPIDQAEELFNPDATKEARTFLSMIGSVLIGDPNIAEMQPVPMIVVFTIRSDRYEPLQTATELTGLKTVVFDALRPMPLTQFKEIILGPASRTLVNGKRFDVQPKLVNQLLEDCGKGADPLPLLGLTLARLYRDYGSDGDLHHEDYTKMGGMAEVIKTEAESILAEDRGTRNTQLEWLHAGFIPCLATINISNNEPMRRLAPMLDLPEDSRPLIQALIEKRLLLSDFRDGEQVVEVAHESLLRQWDVLAAWLGEEGEDLKEADRLKHDATAWETNKKKEAWLREGERLAIGEALAAKPTYRRRLAPVSQFLLASRKRETQRLEQEERQRQAELVTAQERLRVAELRGKKLMFLTAIAVLGLILVSVTSWLWGLWKEGVSVKYATSSFLARLHLVSVLEPEMVKITGGTFLQGDLITRPKNPLIKVTVNEFMIGKYEVTFEEYDRYIELTGGRSPNDEMLGRQRRPVIDVMWEDAIDYAKWLSKATGKRYRLPTASEWEYAAGSGGKDTMWAGTSDENQLKDYAVYMINSKQVEPVGSKKPNDFGLYDMSGNVFEMVRDCFAKAGKECNTHMLRGGCRGNKAESLRVSYEHPSMVGTRNDLTGFRLAQDIP